MYKSTNMCKRITKITFVGTLACTFMVSSIGLVNADSHDVYGPFPITEKSYNGSKKNSVSYGGQIARQLQHNALKKLASRGTKNDPTRTPEKRMLNYLNTKDKSKTLAIIDPSPKSTKFPIKQKMKAENIHSNRKIPALQL